MFVPKWLLFILFCISISSVVALLVVISSRVAPLSSTPTPTSVVYVSGSPMVSPIATNSATPSAMPAAADWKNYKDSDLSIMLDYPIRWSLKVTPGKHLLIASINEAIESSNSAVSKENARLDISRFKKPNRKYTLEEYKKENAMVVKKETPRKIDTFSAVDYIYTTGSDETLRRSIVFMTNNYVYTIQIDPVETVQYDVVEEILKSIEII
ncbi:MAG: hypothetical protein M3P33_02785 [bacterium]|nr:hypothetical protein [bacterium]